MGIGFAVPISAEGLILGLGASIILVPIYLIYRLSASEKESVRRHNADRDASLLAHKLADERNAKLARAAIEAAEKADRG